MAYFIETIRMEKMPIYWATILSDNLHEKLVAIKANPGFYMPSYIVYLLATRTTNYLGLCGISIIGEEEAPTAKCGI